MDVHSCKDGHKMDRERQQLWRAEWAKGPCCYCRRTQSLTNRRAIAR